MPRRNPHRSAFDVSFPDEAPLNPELDHRPPGSATSTLVSRTTTSKGSPLPNASKRKSLDVYPVASAEKRKKTGRERVTPASSHKKKIRYAPQLQDVVEEANTVILGEDRDEDDGGDEKPIRILSEFCIFDPKHDMEVVSLSLLDDNDGVDRQFHSAGYVFPLFLNEEDAGQEDGLDGGVSFQRLRTTAIFRYTIDYVKMDDPVYIETEYAWYVMRDPSKVYKQCFKQFYRPHRIAQVVISTAVENPTWSEMEFYESYLGFWDEMLEEKLQQESIDDAIPIIIAAIEDAEDLMAIPMLRQLVHGHKPSFSRQCLRSYPSHPPRRNAIKNRSITSHDLSGNKDLAVLRPENQNRTSVTPLIDRLALGLFHEHLDVLGAPPKLPDKHIMRKQEQQARSRLLELLTKVMDDRRDIVFPRAKRLHSIYWSMAQIDGIEYSVGDVVIAPAGPFENRKAPVFPTGIDQVPEGASVADYFWFARVIYIDQQHKKFHVQWYQHSSWTVMEELGDPQELFLFNACDDLDMCLVVGKATTHYCVVGSKLIDPLHYYCNFIYDKVDASFKEIDPERSYAIQGSDPPDNCPICLLLEQQHEDEGWREIQDGIVYQGVSYHHHDFVLFQSECGPADIGQILNIQRGSKRKSTAVTIQMLGRINDIIDVCPKDIIKDEKHLFLTDVELDVSVDQFVQKCYVLHQDSVLELAHWLSLSPLHFYIKYHFPTPTPSHWAEKKDISHLDLCVCPSCFEEEKRKDMLIKEFLVISQRKFLRAFDPFGGVGAFGLGLEESGCLKMTHAVEISPSAAKTLQHNSPGTIVYNQCSNVVLRYAIKVHQGHQVNVAKDLTNDELLPAPPQPGDIDCIVAGFPCQPHSRLNMFQKANDRKSHLLLNLLSWVDFLRPKFCFFENVRGFLSYNLNATQAGRYKLEGGIKIGGLKFFINALLAMHYQVRFGLLQAAHYGTPQARVRFFLIAAQCSYPLPLLPQPTHSFPLQDGLEMKFTFDSMQPIRTSDGVAPYKFVSIDDAIADLPRFDWRNPRHLDVTARKVQDPVTGTLLHSIPSLVCDRSRPFCGFAGASVPYHSEPRTSFQAKSRIRPTSDLQHFTGVLREETVERVVNIPLCPRADYKSLEPSLQEWQFASPSSAVARDGFRSGLYGRLDSQRWFQTTVTNVEPTAKQSWVLNPYCKRVVSVRELARSQGFPDHFVFISLNNDVKTMQRQIGNAVPWPVAAALGWQLREAVFERWRRDRQEAIIIE